MTAGGKWTRQKPAALQVNQFLRVLPSFPAAPVCVSDLIQYLQSISFTSSIEGADRVKTHRKIRRYSTALSRYQYEQAGRLLARLVRNDR